MADPEQLRAEALALEKEAADFESQGKPIAAQGKLNQANDLRARVAAQQQGTETKSSKDIRAQAINAYVDDELSFLFQELQKKGRSISQKSTLQLSPALQAAASKRLSEGPSSANKALKQNESLSAGTSSRQDANAMEAAPVDQDCKMAEPTSPPQQAGQEPADLDMSDQNLALRILLPFLDRRRILLRKVYHHMWDMLSLHLTEGRKFFVITGNPGVGKTIFLIYLLAVLRDRETIVVQTPNSFLVFRRDQCEVWNRVSHASENSIKRLDPATSILICDSDVPTETSIPTILISSPKQDTVKNWAKQSSAIFLYMPLWSISELEEAHQLEPHLSPHWQELLRRHGGKARPVLNMDGNVAGEEKKIDTALATSSLGETVRSINNLEIHGEASHTILSYYVDEDSLTVSSVGFSSNYIRGRFRQALAELEWSDWKELLHKANLHRSGGRSASTTILEPGVFRKMAEADHTSKLVRLSEGSEGNLQGMPSVQVKEQAEYDDERPAVVESEKRHGILFLPQQMECESADGLITPNVILQVTQNQTHKLKLAGLYLAAKALGQAENGVHVVFVLQQFRFKDFKLQQIIDNVPQTDAEIREAKRSKNRHRRMAAGISHKEAMEFQKKIVQHKIYVEFHQYELQEVEELKRQDENKRLKQEVAELKRLLAEAQGRSELLPRDR